MSRKTVLKIIDKYNKKVKFIEKLARSDHGSRHEPGFLPAEASPLGDYRGLLGMDYRAGVDTRL
jgi:hypothetical protein